MTTRYISAPAERFQTKVAGFEDSEDRPAILPLTEFKEALRKKMRDVKFANNWSGRSAHVYYQHEKFTRGVISIQGDSFAVMSRTIENVRYNTDNIEHRMQQSKNLNTAVKKAAAALAPWSLDELAAIHARDYTSSRRNQIDEVSRKASNILSSLGLGSTTRDKTDDIQSVTPEEQLATPAFVTLKRMLHQMTDLDVKSKVEDVLRYMQEETELSSNGAAPMFVYVGQDHHGQQHLDTLRLKELMYTAVLADEFPVRHYERSPQEGYDDLVGKISVLNMATVGDYITGVGMKADEGMFYVC